MGFRIVVAAIAAALVASIQATVSAQTEITDVPVVTGAASTTQIAASKRYIAWAQAPAGRQNQSNVYVKERGEDRVKLNPKGTEASLGGFDGSLLAYQLFNGSVQTGSSRIKIVNLENNETRTPKHANSKHWDFWPSLSGRWLLFGLTNANRGTTKILLTNLRSGRTITVDKGPASAYFQPGQVNGRYAVWVRWNDGGKSRAFVFNRKTGKRRAVPTGDQFNWAPSVTRRGVVHFGRTGRRCGSRTKLLRWSKRTGLDRLTRLPDGIDISDSYVSRDRTGTLEMYYVRIDCSNDANGNAHKLRFGGDTEPSPEPSASPTPSPSGPTLTVDISGDGEVTSDPDGIDCGSDCSADFEEGTEITLTAVADDGARFRSWSHPNCRGRDEVCTFVIEDDMTVTATFE